MDSGHIIQSQIHKGKTTIDVRLTNDFVWLTADKMALLFQRDRLTINHH